MTSDEGWDFSRRKLLGSVATLGAAGAIGGTGTLAFFSDEENFTNNRLTAGSFDLKVDWTEHYSDWSQDEEDAVDDGDIMMAAQDTTMQVGEYPSDYTGLPTPNNALVAIPDEDVGDFMDATALESYPDTDDDGLVDYPSGYDVCVHGADTPEDLDPTATPSSLDPTVDDSFKVDGTGLRTNNSDTVDGDGNPKPIIALDDVKPGDFGELTISTHLCDNDGWLALTGRLLENADNTLTEPERKDPDETDGLASGELADEIRVSIWRDGIHENDEGLGYDTTPGDDPTSGNNLLDDEQDEIVLVEEATLSTALNVLESTGISLAVPGGQADGTATFGCSENLVTIDDPEVGDSETVSGASGDTTVTIDDIDTEGANEQLSFEVDGPSELAVGDYPGVCGLTIEGTDGTTEIDYGSGGCVRDSIFLPRPDQDQVGEITSVSFDFCTLVAPEDDRDCFEGSNTYYVGFAWWLPLDHGNEVQTDSVAFDLGFYAEQCRHNPDGIGNIPE